MPIKLTSKEYRVIATVIVVAGVSLAIGAKYFWRAFPEASIEFRVTRDDSAPLAETFIAARGFRLQGYTHAAIFGYDDEAKVYIERTQGLERMTELTRGPVRLWRWSHRWFKSQQKEEFRADVTPAGEIVSFDHEIDEDSPGANLETSAARILAESFLTTVMKRDLNDLEFVESETNKRSQRTDHSFIWKQKSVNLGEGSLRVEVEVDGDQIATYHEFIKVPDQWSRDYRTLRARNDSAQSVDQVFMLLLLVAMLIILVMRIRDHDIPWRMALGFALVGFALYFLGQMNNFSLEIFGYQTKDPYSSFLTRYSLQSVLFALGTGVFIFFLVASSEPVYREAYPGLQALRRTFSWNGLRSRSFFIANVVGIGLTFFFFAYQTIFYLVANKLGAWAPAEVNYSDLLNTRIPWVWVLFIGFLPAIFEEMMFRAFAIAFLKRLVRSLPLAIVLAAFIWGFGHSAYPNQPFFIRGLEVGLGGVVIGIIMLRFGIVATIIWHYSVDALYTAFLLLRSHNQYMQISGGVTAGIMLVPLVIALAAYLKTGTFSEEESLTNASEGVSRAQRESSPAVTSLAIHYQPLSKGRLILAGVLLVSFVAIAIIPVYQFGEGIELKTTREDAYRLADNFLSTRQVNPASYHRVATLSENVNGLAVRYLLERRSVREADQIYRQATKMILWEVRYFRPLEKEEHHVFVDADEGRVFDYQHELGEDTPGASLSVDEARVIAENAVKHEGYQLSGFDLQDSKGIKRRAREDYNFVWQAKSGDARNVGDAHYRLSVDVAGNEVVGFARYFKLPDDWVRKREAITLSTIILGAPSAILIVGLVAGVIILLVQQIKNQKIEWRRAAKVGAALAIVILLTEINAFSTVERSYDTSNPEVLFRLLVAAGYFVASVLAGLAAWLFVGLATSIYPTARQVFSGQARRIWRRDAAVAILISLAAGAALGQINSLVADHFHAFLPVDIGILSGSLDTTWPAASIFLGALFGGIFRAAGIGLIIYLVRTELTLRRWWLPLAGIIFLLSMGPSRAHTLREYLLGWALGLLSATVMIGIVALFYRNNILAYVCGGFLLNIISPTFSLLAMKPRFFVGNGIVLALMVTILVGWMLSGRQESLYAYPDNGPGHGNSPLTSEDQGSSGLTNIQ